MKKVVRLTESDLNRLVKRVIREQYNDEEELKATIASPKNLASSFGTAFETCGDSKWLRPTSVSFKPSRRTRKTSGSFLHA